MSSAINIKNSKTQNYFKFGFVNLDLNPEYFCSDLSWTVTKIKFVRCWGDSPFGKIPAVQAWGPESKSVNQVKDWLGVICNCETRGQRQKDSWKLLAESPGKSMSSPLSERICFKKIKQTCYWHRALTCALHRHLHTYTHVCAYMYTFAHTHTHKKIYQI